MKALITVNIVVLLVVIGVTQAYKGMHNKLEFFFSFACFCISLFALFLSFFFLQLKMNIKKNNNLCPETKKHAD